MLRIFLLAVALHLGGCMSLLMYDTDSVDAAVESRAARTFDRSLVHAVVAEDPAQAADPNFRPLAEQTRRMLACAGFKVLPPEAPAAAADVLVTVRFDVGAWRPYTYTSVRSVYVETGIESSRTVERINKRGEKVSTTTYTPKREFAGLEDYEQPSSKRDIVLRVDARANPARGGAPEQMWSVTATSENSFLFYPATPAHLLKAVQSQVGSTASTKQTVGYKEPGVAFIAHRQAASAPPARGRSGGSRDIHSDTISCGRVRS
jgi:hypothetical protein